MSPRTTPGFTRPARSGTAAANAPVPAKPKTITSAAARNVSLGLSTGSPRRRRGIRIAPPGAAKTTRSPLPSVFRFRTGGGYSLPRVIRLLVGLRHRAIVERLVQRLLVDPRFSGDVAQRSTRRGRRFDDLRGAVVADVGVERGGRGQRQLRIAFARLAVGPDTVDALLREEAGGGGKEADRVEQVPREQRDEDVELEVTLHPADRDRLVVPDHLRRHLRDDLGNDRVDLARHDRASFLELRQEDLAQACAGA